LEDRQGCEFSSQRARKLLSDFLQAKKQVGRVRQENEQKCVDNIHAAFKQHQASLKCHPWVWDRVE
jgi:hypothetical protein